MVLKRDAKTLGLTSGDIDALIDHLCAVGHQQRIHFLWRPTLRDPRDELVLELAVAAGCSHILTHNARDFDGVEQFGVSAIPPAAYLRHLGEQP
jgi:hypothetical protein